MEEEIKTIEFCVPINHIAPLKKAANEMGVDVIFEDGTFEYVDHAWKKAYLLGNETTLFSLGYLTGINTYDSFAVNPLREAMDILQNKITDFVKQNPDAQKIIDDIDKKHSNENDSNI